MRLISSLRRYFHSSTSVMYPAPARVNTNLQNVSHCIFDLDGLLLDTEPIYEDNIRTIAKSYDKPYPYDVRMKLLGTTEQMTAKIAVADLKLPITVEEFLKIFDELGRKRLGDAKLLPGAKKLIEHLHTNQIPFCLATSSGEDMVKIKIRDHKNVFSLFRHKVCGSTDPEVKQGKPAPDIFLVAASRFPDKPNPENCLVFEDSPNGVKAARAAGMQCVMVPDPRVPEEQRSLATIILDSLEEFKPELFGLPKFK